MQQLGGSGSNDVGRGIALDSSGNIYIIGTFNAAADFDPGAGTTTLTPAGVDDLFIVKLNSSGALVWAKQIGGTGSDYGYAIKIDSSDNIYITGYFQNTVDFDPGAGTSNLTSAGAADIYVSKLDTSGALVWAKQIGGTSGDIGYSITADSSGNVYTVGSFADAVDFDPGAGTSSLTSAGGNDVFISKLDSSGAFVWAKQVGGTVADVANAVAVDSSGNVHITGSFAGTADFDPGAGTSNLTAAGGNDIFIGKLDSTGALAWAKQIGGTGSDIGYSIAVDSDGGCIHRRRFCRRC